MNCEFIKIGSITVAMSEEDMQKYKHSINKKRWDTNKIHRNPVKCSQCKLRKTCEKRKVRNIRKCPYGIRIQKKGE